MRFVEAHRKFSDRYLRDNILKRIPKLTLGTWCHFDGTYTLRKDAAVKAREIRLNNEKYTWALTFDVDSPFAMEAHEDAGLPPPNVAVVNPENGHAHLTWILKAPVSHGDAARQGPQKLLNRTYFLMSVALGADQNYTHGLTHNPLATERLVYVSDAPAHDLGDLIECVDHWSDRADKVWAERQERNKKPETKKAPTHEVGGRNCGLFDDLRFWAYDSVSRFTDYDDFYAAAFAAVQRMNKHLEEPLPISEERSLAKSVSRWTWKNKAGFALKAEENPLPRGVAGALAAAKTKAERTQKAVMEAVSIVIEKTGRVVMSMVAQVAGISERTLRNYRNAVQFAAVIREGVSYTPKKVTRRAQDVGPAISNASYQDVSPVSTVEGGIQGTGTTTLTPDTPSSTGEPPSPTRIQATDCIKTGGMFTLSQKVYEDGVNSATSLLRRSLSFAEWVASEADAYLEDVLEALNIRPEPLPIHATYDD